MSSNSARTTSSILEYFKWKFTRFMLERKQNKLLKYYDNQQYDKLIKLFKTQKDYEELTLDSFPFLYFMISENNAKAVESFVQKYQHRQFMLLNDNNTLKCTPMQYAFLEEKQQIIQILQNKGANIEINNSQGQNTLHLSAIYKRNEAFNLGIKKNLNINQVDIFGNTPFHYACRVGSIQMITTMILAKAKKVANNLNQFPIHMAIESGNLQAIKLLQNDITRPYPKYHPIHSAARTNQLAIFKYVYQKNPKFISQKDQGQMTPLHHAISIQSLEIVKFILERLPKYASPVLDAQDTYGNTPLHMAFLTSNGQILTELIQRKPNVEIKNKDGMTALDYGYNSENMVIKRFIMDYQGWKQHGRRNP